MKITFDGNSLKINDYIIYNIDEKIINSIIDSWFLFFFENNYNITKLKKYGPDN